MSGRTAVRGPVETALVLALALSGTAWSTSGRETSTPPPAETSEIGRNLDLFLSRLEPFGFAGAVLVAEGDRVHLDRGYGLADRARHLPNTAETVFQVGSITKQFTAAAIMKLVADGRLQTSDTLERFFDEVPPDKRSITLHHLLTHTGGVVAGDTQYFDDNSREAIVNMVLTTPLSFEPGTSFLYSNMGYALLAAVIEKVSGDDYETFLRQHLLRPAGMEATGYRLAQWQSGTVAHWYVADQDNGDQLDRTYPDWNFIGSGRIRSTTADMLLWHRALQSDRLLPADLRRQMYAPVLNDYAYGWVVRDTEHGRVVQHNGASSDGAAADYRRYVDEDLVIVIFCNADGEQTLFGNRLADHIDDLAHGVEIAAPPEVDEGDDRELDSFVGVFTSPTGHEVGVDLRRGMLVARGRGQSAVDELYGVNQVADAKRLSAEADRALTELIEHGRDSAFAELLVDPERRERLGGYIVENRSAAEPELGAYRGLRVLGTVDDWITSLGGQMTIVLLDFERGSRVFRLHWRDGGVLAVGGAMLSEPAEFWLRPAAKPDVFGGYHLPTTTTIQLHFGRDDADRVISLTVGSAADSGATVYMRR